MSITNQYDVIVIGGGSGGLTCAIGAKKLNKKVLLVERRKLGGECTWSGCIPSKAFIQASKDKQYTKATILDKVRSISEDIYKHENPEVIKSHGIDLVLGEASFKTNKIIVIDGKEYHGNQIVISTGTSPFVPPIKGLNKDNLLTNDNFFLQKQLPDSIIFIGAGVISMELSIPLARMGVKVSIFEKNPDILRIAEPAIGKHIKEILKLHNIDLYTSVDISGIASEDGKHTIHFMQNNQSKSLSADKFFVASGRSPNISALNLDAIDIQYNQFGIFVNEYLQTTHNNIYALGDVVGPARFSHVAGIQGELFVRNLIIPFCKKKNKKQIIPYTVFTDPEFAQVGMLEADARKAYGDNIQVYEYYAKDSERATISMEDHFYFKLIMHKGLIAGATVMGAKAGEMSNLLQWFYSSKTPFRNLVNSIQAYPSYGDFLRKVAKQVMLNELLSHPVVSFFRPSKK